MKKKFEEGYNLNSAITVRLPDFHKKYIAEQCKEMSISASEYFRFLVLQDYRRYFKNNLTT